MLKAIFITLIAASPALAYAQGEQDSARDMIMPNGMTINMNDMMKMKK